MDGAHLIWPAGRRRSRERRALVSPRTAFWITDILSDPDAREYIFGRGGSLEFPFPVAVKTGTSQAYHDNWTIGYTRDVTVGVWVGNFDRTPLRDSTGVTGAGPIFHAVMLAANSARRAGDRRGRSPFAPPAGRGRDARDLRAVGDGGQPWCPARQREWLAAGADALPCSWHHLRTSASKALSSRSWPAEYRQWAAGAQAAARCRRSQAVHAVAEAARARRTEPLRISNPPAGATYLIDPTLRREFQTLPLARRRRYRPGRIEWIVDGGRSGPPARSARSSGRSRPGGTRSR